MSDPKQHNPDSNNHVPPWQREPADDPDQVPLGRATDEQDWLVQRGPNETAAHLRPLEGRGLRVQKQPDIFAEALAKVMREQLERELVEAPSVLLNRPSFGIAAKFAVAAGTAALVAMIFVVAFPASQNPAEKDVLSALPTWQSLKSSLFATPQRKPAPTLVVRDDSGPANEPLSLGVNVKSPGPGSTVTIDGMPASARLTVGRRMSTGEWRVAAQEISEASIIPPADFVGVMNLTAELRGPDGAAMVRSVVRPTWTATVLGAAVESSASVASASAATAPSAPAAPMPQQQQPQQPQPQQQQAVALPGPPVVARTEPPARQINPDEVAGFVKRAEELLAIGDLPAARLLLLRAAESHDGRAALLLAKTFDPTVSRQFGMAVAESDLAQARNWYQKAEEWGATEARHELDALASYR